jgi:hypothetical protein
MTRKKTTTAGVTRRDITANLAGRVNKIRTTNPLVPLFEAVSNSVHAIEALGKPGVITVRLLRSPQQQDLLKGLVPPITGFEVADTGIGFTEQNMRSFCEADSMHKASLGGKGVGRFTWLKFFAKASVESTYTDQSDAKRRSFEFTVQGIHEQPISEVDSPSGTRLTLNPLLPDHERKMRKTAEEVALELIEHFIAAFATDAMPPVTLDDGGSILCLGDMYRSSLGSRISSHDFTLSGRAFAATAVKMRLGNGSHAACLCAHHRVSEKIQLGRRDQFLAERFCDEEQNSFALHIFVLSEYLDNIVHDDRDGFRFPEPGTLDSAASGAVTKDQLLTEVMRIAHTVLEQDIDKVRQANAQRVRAFVVEEAPQYRRLIGKHAAVAENIHATEPVAIDQHLRRLQFEDELATRDEIRALLVRSREADDIDAEWKERAAVALSKLSKESKDSLANYIVKRKMILELLGRRIEVTEDSRAREEAVHRLIFPMRSTSDEISYDEHNLWIIDERLAYHYYLASDKPLTSIPGAGSDSRKEPDIIVFNRAIVLNDRPEGERLESVVIIEFKRPGEVAMDSARTPVDQILEYIELLREGSQRSRTGRMLQPSNNTTYFGYAICDLHPRLKKELKRHSLRELPDGRGMFHFFEDHRAYIEVISYDKLLDDARKRNRVLFEKLALPSTR